MVGREGKTNPELQESTGRLLCKFLELDYLPMHTRLKRIHGHPLSAVLSNWSEIENAVRQTELSVYLEEERNWRKDANGNWTVS